MKVQVLVILVFCFIISSCNRSVEDRLLGKWEFSQHGIHVNKSIFINDTTDDSFYGTISFREGGSGTFTDEGDRKKIEWATENENVTLTFEGEFPRVYEVKINSKETQSWYHYKKDSSNTNGIGSSKEWISMLILNKVEN